MGYATFDQPGGWGLELTIPQAGGVATATRLRLDVLAEPSVPAVGEAAIPSQTLTVRDQPDLSRLTSDPNPDPAFYQMSVAEAIAARTPFLVAFSTPGYCQTAVCSPNQMVLKQLRQRYQGQINFIHVEVYPYPFGKSFQAQRRVEAMGEWKLRTEPWTSSLMQRVSSRHATRAALPSPSWSQPWPSWPPVSRSGRRRTSPFYC